MNIQRRADVTRRTVGVLRRDRETRWRVTGRRSAPPRWGVNDRTPRPQAIRLARHQTLRESPPCGCYPGLEVGAVSQAAYGEKVSGDFCDVFPLGSGDVALVLGDVCGHGRSAARCVPGIKSALRTFLKRDRSPGRALSRLNDWLCLDRGWATSPTATFVTAAVIVLNGRTGLGSCARAGADAPLLLRPLCRPEGLGVEGTALGMIAGRAFEDDIFQVGVGDLLLLMTDGVTEARHGDVFLDVVGAVGLATEAYWSAGGASACCAVLDGARRFAGGVLHDDASVLTIGCCPIDQVGSAKNL